MVTKYLVIVGRVQGVGYRMSMLAEANRSGVTGWVRNRRDGNVEAMVQGAEENVQSMIEWARRGPGFSQVENVDVSEGSGNFSQFKVVDTI